MAFGQVGVGSAPNDGTGNVLRTAFQVANTNSTLLSAMPLSGLENVIINGNFSVWQRGTSFTDTSDDYTADRWVADFGAGQVTTTRQSLTPGALTGFEPQYALRRTIDTPATFQALMQRIEDVRTLAGRTALLTFWARADAARSIQDIRVFQDFGSGGSTTTDTNIASSVAVTTAWTRYAFVVTLPSVSGKTIGSGSNLALRFYENRSNSAFSGWIEYAGISLRRWTGGAPSAASALPFETRPLALELALCQRYFVAKTVRSENGSRHIPLPPMRAAPTVTVGVGSAGNITADGFELSHSAAADCAVTASAEL